MHDYGFIAWISLVFIVVSAIWEIVLNTLNAGTFAKQSENDPEIISFGSDYDFRKARSYEREKGILDNIEACFETGFWIILIFSGILSPVLGFFAGFGNSIIVAACFITSVFVLKSLLMLPFSIYDTFSLERRFGFSRISPGLFILDRLKVLLIVVPLLFALSSVALLIYSFFESYSWIPFTLGMALFTITMSFLTPLMIRLFFKPSPLDDPELEGEARSILERAGLKLKALKKIDASVRSSHANAFFFGAGPAKQIVLFDTLLNILSKKEVLGVIAHEVAHCARKHIWRLFLIQNLAFAFGFICSVLMMKNSFILTQFSIDVEYPPYLSISIGFLLCIFVFESISWILYPLLGGFSRRYEFEADRMGAELCGDSLALSSALRTLCKGNLSILSPHPLYTLFKNSHPSLLERVHKLEQMAPRKDDDAEETMHQDENNLSFADDANS